MLSSRGGILVLVMNILIGVASQGGDEHRSEIHLVNNYNMNQIMNCYVSDPIKCRIDQDWTLLFFNSNNSRQLQTFEHLIPGLAIEIAYSKLQHKQGQLSYPNAVVIDCFTSVSLCSSVGSNDLPLVLYRSYQTDQTIKYKGYVTLAGLISFIKTHDPRTSYLAEQYHPTGGHFNDVDFADVPKKQSNKILKEWMTKLQQIIANKNINLDTTQNQYAYIKQQEKQKSNNQTGSAHIQQKKQIYSTGSQHQIFSQQTQKKLAEENISSSSSSTEQKKEQQKKEQQKKEQQKKEQQLQQNGAPTNEYARLEEQMQMKKNKTSGKKNGKKNKQGKQAKLSNQQKKSQFMAAVDWSTQTVVSGFALIGFSEVILECVACVSYVFFFIIFGIICLLAAVA